MMERILGTIPYRMAKKTKAVDDDGKTKYFYHGSLDWDQNSSAGRYVRNNCKPLRRYMQSESEEHRQLFALMERMLEYDPTRRVTLAEAMHDEFFAALTPAQRGVCS